MASQTLDILCGQCGTLVVRYQKKGSGQLIRLYLDRVTEPESIAQLKSVTSKKDIPALACANCDNRMGLPMIHDGGRYAYRMIKGTFRRKVGK